MTRISDLAVAPLEKLLELRNDPGFDFDEEDAVENRTARKYLFRTTSHSTRCFSESDWGKKVKQVFAEYSPRKVCVCVLVVCVCVCVPFVWCGQVTSPLAAMYRQPPRPSCFEPSSSPSFATATAATRRFARVWRTA